MIGLYQHQPAGTANGLRDKTLLAAGHVQMTAVDDFYCGLSGRCLQGG
jgi:hypothetical protein